jgi:nucleotide-binding universal stress UspA family protein
MTGPHEIVVGIDGSDASAAALRWGADDARHRGAALRVVTCWTYPMLPWGLYQPPLSGEEFERAALDVAETTVTKVLGADREGLDVSIDVVAGTASLVLLEYDAAEMLVVGSRGRGGFTGLLLGSVSQHLAEHARCPVVIVHEPAAQVVD